MCVAEKGAPEGERNKRLVSVMCVAEKGLC